MNPFHQLLLILPCRNPFCLLPHLQSGSATALLAPAGSPWQPGLLHSQVVQAGADNEVEGWNRMIHVFKCLQQWNDGKVFHEENNAVLLLEYEKCCWMNSHLSVDVCLILKIPY